MGHLVTGITLLILAVLVTVGFVLEVGSQALEGDSPIMVGPDGPSPALGGRKDAVIDLEPLEEEDRPPAFLETEELEQHDGILTRRERARLTDRGYLPYTVQRNESLRDIAERYLGREALWRVIQEHNPVKLLDPQYLRPGTEILIPVWLREDF